MTEFQTTSAEGRDYASRVSVTNALDYIPPGYSCENYKEKFQMLSDSLLAMKKTRIEASKNQIREVSVQTDIEFLMMWKAILVASDITINRSPSQSIIDSGFPQSSTPNARTEIDIDRELLIWINTANRLIPNFVTELFNRGNNEVQSLINHLLAPPFCSVDHKAEVPPPTDRDEMCEEILRLLLLKAQATILGKYQNDKSYQDLLQVGGFSK